MLFLACSVCYVTNVHDFLALVWQSCLLAEAQSSCSFAKHRECRSSFQQQIDVFDAKTEKAQNDKMQAVEWDKVTGEGLEHNACSLTATYLEAAPSRRDPNKRLILKDGIHLFCPTEEHHSILAREGTDSTSKGESDM